MKKREAEQEARGMLIDILGQAMLESDMPEEKKICIRIMLEIKRTSVLSTEKFDEILKSKSYTPELHEKRKEALALLQKVNAELEGFDSTVSTVAPPRTDLKSSLSESKKNRNKGDKLCIRIFLPKF